MYVRAIAMASVRLSARSQPRIAGTCAFSAPAAITWPTCCRPFSPQYHIKNGCAPVHLDVTGIICKLALILLTQRERIARLRQQSVEKLDVARVKLVIKLVETRMMQDQH